MANEVNTGLVADSRYVQHLTGSRHPESPERYSTIMKALDTYRKQLTLIEPRMADSNDILRCHSLRYCQKAIKEIQELKKVGKVDGRACISTGDAQICPASWDVARLAAGGVLSAVDAVMNRVAKRVFCVIRPPGHHATECKGMGFCLLNNVAIATRYVQKKYGTKGVKKVLIVDWDVHHGNGTQDIFNRDPSVFYFSTHQGDIYPGTGRTYETGDGRAKGTVMNIPIPSGKGSGKLVIEAFKTKLVEAMKSFCPDFVFISAGFDGHKLDPLGGFDLTDDDFAELTRIVCTIADEYAEGRVVSVLEGGYSLRALSTAVPAHVKAL